MSPPADPAAGPARTADIGIGGRMEAGPTAGSAPTRRKSSTVLTGLLTGAVAVAAGAAALVSGLSLADGDRTMVVLPLAAVAAVALGLLALTRFSAFVLLLLGVRSSVDLFRLSGPAAGTTSTDTVTARGLDPSSMVSVLFLLASALWLTAQYADGRRLRGSPLRTALLCFVAACAVSVLGSPRPEASALEVLRILSVATMFVVLQQLITDRAALVRTLVAAYAGAVVPLGYTLVGLVAGSPAAEVKGEWTRITGPFTQSNAFARYLVFMIVFGVAVLPALSRRLQVVMGGVLALSSVFLLMTLTRGAILTAVVGVVVVALVQRRTRLLLAVVVAALAALLVVPGVADRFADLGEQASAAPGASSGSLDWRLDYWAQVLPLAADNPVTGIGLDVTPSLTEEAKQPHSDVVRVLVETGVVGLAAYAAVHVALLRTTTTALRRSVRGSLEHGVATGALGCAVCFVLGSLAANMISGVVSLWYLMAFAAAASFVARGGPVGVPGSQLEAAPAPSSTAGAPGARPS